MTRIARAVILVGVTAALFAGVAAAGSLPGRYAGIAPSFDDAIDGNKTLQKSAMAYQKLKAFTDVMHFEIEVPGDDKQEFDIEFAFGAGSDSYVKRPGMVVTARGKQVFVVRDNVADKYLEVPMNGDLGKTLNELLRGNANLPVQFDMRAKRGMSTPLRPRG